MNNLRNCFLFGIILFLVGCTTFRPTEQRDYVLPGVLTGEISPSKEKSETWVARHASFWGGAAEISPLFLSEAEQICYDEILNEGPAEGKFSTCKEKYRKLLEQKTCFDLWVQGGSAEAANLKYKQVLFDGEKKIHRLQPAEPLVGPTQVARSITVSGSTFPYFVYTQSARFCSSAKLNLASGFSVYVQPRHEPGLKPIDFVWSINPEHKTTRFKRATFGGIPLQSPFKEKERLAEIEAKINRVLAE